MPATVPYSIPEDSHSQIVSVLVAVTIPISLQPSTTARIIYTVKYTAPTTTCSPFTRGSIIDHRNFCAPRERSNKSSLPLRDASRGSRPQAGIKNFLSAQREATRSEGGTFGPDAARDRRFSAGGNGR
ncbi:hypothetical protein ALC62_02020 [Cyphomyrmex costatus]|uniref:Uncharacterized protein n=1 Tax=Cyphomyrmex costatus TaxID=456900 RepID=A0A151INK0_9HYME|nr:hypothetical protein ALC62_02020 [Cyphomyrmex costatus]